MELLPVKVLGSDIISVVWMEPLRLLVVRPLGVVEVFQCSWLIVSFASSRVFVYCLFTSCTSVIYAVFDVVSLSADRVGEDLISLVDLLEHVCCLISLLSFPTLLEVWMIFLS